MSLEGTQFAHYTILTRLKRGGMSDVYLADDAVLKRRVAVKVIQIDALAYHEGEEMNAAIRLFLNEARTVANLDHPHILPVFDSGQASVQGEAFMYMVMPYRRAGSLADWLYARSTRPVLAPLHVAHIVAQTADALQFAHEQGIVHQDVKPTNVLLYNSVEYAEQLNLQLADFGVAKILSTTSESLTIRGTPSYMAPEQWEGKADAASDQYSLAVLAYELLTGWLPFLGQNLQQLYQQHSYTRPRAPSALNPRIPTSLDTVVLKGLAKQPSSRFPSISAFAAAFEREAGKGHTIAAVFSSNEDMPLEDLQESPEPMAVGVRPERLAGTAVIADPLQRKRSHILIPFFLAIVLLFGAAGLMLYNASSNAQQTARRTTATSPSRSHSTSTSIALSSIHNTATASSQATQAARGKQTAIAVAAVSTASAQSNATSTAVAYANATSTAIAAGNATATAQASATRIVEATATAYAQNYSGPPQLNDPLQDNSQGNNWDKYGNNDAGCSFEAGAYHAYTAQSGTISPCFAGNTNFSDCFYQIEMTITKGDRGGIIFRADPSGDNLYYFQIDTQGNFALIIYQNYNQGKTLASGNDTAIHTGLNQRNLIAIEASGNSFMLFVNMRKIATAADNANTYTQGQIGVIAESVNNPTDIAFSDAEVWQLSQ